MDDEIYLSISFPRVSRIKSDEIVKAATDAAGKIPYNVYYDNTIDDDEESS